MKKKIFITGSNGFVGKKLSAFLEQRGYQIRNYSDKMENHHFLQNELISFGPDVVVHLAGLSNVPYCEQHLDEAYISNVTGTSILLELMIKLPVVPHVIFASSAQVYNMQSPIISNVPVDETFELAPSNTYGRTKLQAERIVSVMSSIYGLRAVVLRLFNHSHKDQDHSFFLPSMYQQILDAQNGGTISVGNLEVSRDFSLVNDLLISIESIILNFHKMDSFELFNVCSGQARSLRELVLAMVKLSGKELQLVSDPKRFRGGEAKIIIGNGDRLRKKVGMTHPKRTIEEYVRYFAE